MKNHMNEIIQTLILTLFYGVCRAICIYWINPNDQLLAMYLLGGLGMFLAITLTKII